MPIKKQLSIENILNHRPLPTRKPTENTNIYLLTATGKQQTCITRKQNVYTLWTIFGPIIKPTKARKSSKIQQLTHQGITYTNDKDIANTLNNYFSNIVKTLTENLTSDNNYYSYLKSPTISSLYLEPAQNTEMIRIIKNLKNKKSPGHDNITPKLLKTCVLPLSGPLTYIITLSFASGHFPSQLNISKVIPTFKKKM